MHIFSFLINVCEFKFSIKLALCAIIVFLDLDGLVGLREAQRIYGFFLYTDR